MSNEQKTVLIADDEPANREVLREQLEAYVQGNYEIREAENGNEAITSLRESPVDLAILDMNMPGMSGEKVVRQLKTEGYTSALCIYTASGKNFREFEKETGARVFIKPSDRKILFAYAAETLA
tara:strand:+ start:396 stop:767 length:372 start_codon:yes stop_codon:yes gene_type:complete